MANNDNHRRICDDKAAVDVKVAATATRCLGMLWAPDERMFWEQAWERWGIAQFVMNEVFENPQVRQGTGRSARRVDAGTRDYSRPQK
jgi:hypothetical protein